MTAWLLSQVCIQEFLNGIPINPDFKRGEAAVPLGSIPAENGADVPAALDSPLESCGNDFSKVGVHTDTGPRAG